MTSGMSFDPIYKQSRRGGNSRPDIIIGTITALGGGARPPDALNAYCSKLF